jgi:hypothetical protein
MLRFFVCHSLLNKDNKIKKISMPSNKLVEKSKDNLIYYGSERAKFE